MNDITQTGVSGGQVLRPSPANSFLRDVSGGKPGAGVSTQDGAVGPVAAGGAATRVMALITELLAGMPDESAQNEQAKVADASMQLRDVQTKTDVEQQKTASNLQQEYMNEQQKVMQEAQSKLDEATKDDSNVSIWDKVKLAFQFLAAAVSIAVGIVLAATGVGAGLGAMMIAGGVAGLVGAVNSMIETTNNGVGILGSVAKAFGANSDQASQADQAFSIGLAVVGAALAIGGLAAGASSAAAAVGDVVDAASETAVAAASEGFSDTAQVTARAAGAVGNITSGLTQIATAQGDGVAANFQEQATFARADAQDDTAEGSKDQAEIDRINSLIKLLIQNMGADFNAFKDQFASAMQTLASTHTAAMSVQFV